MMRTILAILAAETIKLKHTATLWLSVIAPAAFLFLCVLGTLDHDPTRGGTVLRTPANAWNLFLLGPWELWACAAPLLISAEAVGLASQEHAGRHWKQLFALPIPRWSVFVVKLLMCMLLTAVSFLLFTVGVIGAGLLLSAQYHMHMESAIPWMVVLRMAGRAYLACWCVMSIQMWLSMRFSGFAIPAGTALAAVAVAAAVAKRPAAYGWWPWTMPAGSLPWERAHVFAFALVSPAGFVLIALLACWRLSRRQVI